MAVVEVSDKVKKNTIDRLLKKFEDKRKKKGNLSFNSPLESFGKTVEEFNEVSEEVHDKDWDKYQEELLDLAITALWGIASIEANKESK